MPKAVKAKAVQSTTVAPAGGSEPRPAPAPVREPFNFPASHSFVYMAHPAQWEVYPTDDGPKLLPFVKEVRRTPGVSGVRKVKGHDDGEASITIAKMQREGWILIDENESVEAFGEQFTGYVHTYPGRSGTINLNRWNRLYRLGSVVHMQRDMSGYYKFLEQVKDRYVGEPTDEIRHASKLKLQKMARDGKAKNASPSAQYVSEVVTERLSAFDG